MKASDLLSALEEACLRPLFVEIALRERKVLEEHEQRHLQAFEDGLNRFKFVVPNIHDDADGTIQDSAEAGEGPADDEDRSIVRRADITSVKTEPTPSASSLSDPNATSTVTPPVRGERTGTFQAQQRADSSKSRAASPKKATTNNVAESRSSNAGRSERDIKDETWEQVRHS